MTFSRRLVGLSSTVLAAGLAVTGCDAGGASAASGDKPTVLASFYPLAFVAERIAGAEATVENLTQPGVEPHDLELTGRQVAGVAEADLVLYLRGFQPAVDEAVEQNAADRALDVAETVDLLPASPDEGEEQEDLDGDPHIWLDPANMIAISESAADRLAEILPDRADTFHDRADELTAELTDLDDEYRAGLAGCQRQAFVTSHAAFGYLARRYGLEMIGISGLSPDAEPSPARLAEVQQVVRDEGVTTIFYETLVDPKVAETLADDLGIASAVLDPIEGLTDDTTDQDYLSLMRANLDALEEANGCS